MGAQPSPRTPTRTPSPATFHAKLLAEDRGRLDVLKHHPRETYGDVVHRLIAEELDRRGRDEPSEAGAAAEAA